MKIILGRLKLVDAAPYLVDKKKRKRKFLIGNVGIMGLKKMLPIQFYFALPLLDYRFHYLYIFHNSHWQ